MALLAEDLRMAFDRVAFARSVGVEPDGWQGDHRDFGPPRVSEGACINPELAPH